MSERMIDRRKAKLIPAAKAHAEWRKDPAYLASYDALAEEFEIMVALMQARRKAGLSQSEIARRMRTTQPAVARLESGAHRASLSSIRSYAAATGHRLRISLEPLPIKEPVSQ